MDWLTEYKIPLGSWIKSLVDLLNAHAAGFFDLVSWTLGGLIDGMTSDGEGFQILKRSSST